MIRTWVLGDGGLIGGATSRALHAASAGTRWFASAAVDWSTPTQAHRVLREGVAELARPGDPWQLVWCAGAATTSSSRAALDAEHSTFSAVCTAIEQLPTEAKDRGSLLCLSSAGGIYAGTANGSPISEADPPAPLSEYGHAKLALEAAARRAGVALLLPRIANVYGPGQNLAKPQGLISRLCVAAVTRAPVELWGPEAPAHDYVFVDDLARRLAAGLDRLAAVRPTEPVVKIMGSGTTTSIADLIALVGELAGGPVPVRSVAPNDTPATTLAFASRVWTDLEESQTGISLREGVRVTLAAVRTMLPAIPPPNARHASPSDRT